MKILSEERPPAYKQFIALDDDSGEMFLNFLVLSKYNKFYVAGKKFNRWALITGDK